MKMCKEHRGLKVKTCPLCLMIECDNLRAEIELLKQAKANFADSMVELLVNRCNLHRGIGLEEFLESGGMKCPICLSNNIKTDLKYISEMEREIKAQNGVIIRYRQWIKQNENKIARAGIKFTLK